ncbi:MULTISPECIES: precorrin-8X methylmutase [unclassified Desulfovibrio]|uniref:precorrin-8X methylmutase n=1 Tax=unclassified Desulfovibrio TaxID=2593640 RepID=UPI0013EA67BE|nr:MULTISPECIES: precorrin-8X methylmutase [unclassified Desulfovibrio]
MPVTLDPAATPEAIEARSFAIIDAELPEPRPFAGPLWEVARRCIHALGDTAILPDLRLSGSALERGVSALRAGKPVFTDTRMAAAGLPARRMARLGVEVVPLMGLDGVGEAARAEGVTRAAAGIRMISDRLAGAVIVIGNAPTALLALLEELEGRPAEAGPALIVGMPVGFVNATQSKELLAESPWPHFTLLGRKGGSAVAAASVNALAELALQGGE